MSQQPMQTAEMTIYPDNYALRIDHSDDPKKQEPRLFTIKQKLIILTMTCVNFLPNFLTWYSILSVTGLDPSTLYQSTELKGLMIVVFVTQIFWIVIFFLGIIVITMKNLNWWQLCYQLEGVKEDGICRLMFLVIGAFTLSAEIKIWTSLRDLCTNSVDSACQDLSSDMTFAFTCVTAVIGLWTISTYNASFHKQLPYHDKAFSFLSFPITKITCIGVPKVWSNSRVLLSDLESMLNLAESAENNLELYEIIKEEYDHLQWGWVKEMQIDQICELRKAFRPNKDSMMARRGKAKNSLRLFSEEDTTDLILKRVYLVSFFLLLSPVFILIMLCFIIMRVILKLIELAQNALKDSNPKTCLGKTFHALCNILFVIIIIVVVLPIVLVALIPALVEYYLLGIVRYLIDKYPLMATLLGGVGMPVKQVENITLWEPLPPELSPEDRSKIEEYLTAYRETFLSIYTAHYVIKNKKTVDKETATRILSAVVTLSPVLKEELAAKVSLQQLFSSSLIKYFRGKLSFMAEPEKIRFQMATVIQSLTKDPLLSMQDREDEMSLCSPDLSETLNHLIKEMTKEADISLYFETYKTELAKLGHKDANTYILSLLKK